MAREDRTNVVIPTQEGLFYAYLWENEDGSTEVGFGTVDAWAVSFEDYLDGDLRAEPFVYGKGLTRDQHDGSLCELPDNTVWLGTREQLDQSATNRFADYWTECETVSLEDLLNRPNLFKLKSAK